MITCTPAALAKIREFQQSDPTCVGKAFRVAVDSGGCSGYKYEFRFDAPLPADHSLQLDGVTIVVDPDSAAILQQSTLEYREDFQESGFVVQNPNATSSCGCGKSFGV